MHPGCFFTWSVDLRGDDPKRTPPVSLSLTLPPLFAMPRTLSDEMVSYNGLPDMVPTPRTVASGRGRIEVDWQQIAQTQRQFTGLFRNPQAPFAIGIQSVFKRNNDDGHIEIATGCLLQSADRDQRPRRATTSPSPVSPMRPG